MIKFAIDPEYCLILKAMNEADSLRKAAILLETDAPALVRKVRKIADEHGLLQKNGQKWSLTERGRQLALWTDQVMATQSEALKEEVDVRISSFAWLSEEILIPNSNTLINKKNAQIKLHFNMVAPDNENELIHGRTDYVIQGHPPIDPLIAYKKIKKLDWLVVVPISFRQKISKLQPEQIISLLQKEPFIRHTQIRPESVLGFNLESLSHISANSVLGVRSAVVSGIGWSVLPALSIQNYVINNRLLVVPAIKTFLSDEVSIWWLRSRKDMSATTKEMVNWLSGII